MQKKKKEFTLPGHNYTEPYNPLEKELKLNPITGEILEIYQKPTGKTDAVAMRHDVDYSICESKNKMSENVTMRLIKKGICSRCNSFE